MRLIFKPEITLTNIALVKFVFFNEPIKILLKTKRL